MEPRDILIVEVAIGFFVTALVTIFYGLIAPWYKQSAGRYIFGLLLALTLVLANSFVRLFFPAFDQQRIGGMVLFGFYILAILSVGAGIYSAQIGRYKRKKFIEREKERHRQL